jgi:hypothetical protein
MSEQVGHDFGVVPLGIGKQLPSNVERCQRLGAVGLLPGVLQDGT